MPPNAPIRHQLPFFLASFAWNYGLGMTWLVVPLYGHARGLSGWELGLLFSLPSTIQIFINLLGGAYVDRKGGKRIMLLSAALMAASALAMPFAERFATLFAAQMFLVLSRATFWPANWSMAAELPGDRGVQAGRVNAVTNLAHILGNGGCGFILTLGGFTATFFVLAALASASFVACLLAPQGTRRSTGNASLFGNYLVLARMPVIYYGVLCAYLSSLPISLTMSFYPLLLKFQGFGAEVSGVLLALRAVGGIATGLLVARFVRTGPASPWPVIAGACTALGVTLQPLVDQAAVVGCLLFALGVGTSLQNIYFQVTLAEVVEPRMRGSAMALAGMGWGLSHLSTPLAMGFFSDRYGIAAAFYFIGGFTLLVVGGLAILRRWAFSRTKLAT